jgi:hypothetical protein
MLKDKSQLRRIHQMRSAKNLIIGAIFAIFGAAGIILGPLLGFSEIARPWSFILGFIFGLLAGIGGALSLFGFHEMRKEGG